MDHRHTTILQKTAQKITQRPGVYLYYDKRENVIYVGKAKNLRKRVSQYFTQHHSNGAGQKTHLLVSQIASIKTVPTDSEFDALLLEATLIRKYLPKYNAIARDDKSPLYVAITFDEPLPRVLFTRKRALEQHLQLAAFGPFQSGQVARRLMQSVRRIIPYCTQKRRDGAPCFYTHIGLCNPCPSVIKSQRLSRLYRANLRRIALLLSGQAHRVRVQLEQTMRQCAERMAFEEAGEYKRQLAALDGLLTHSFDPSVYTDPTSERLTELAYVLRLPSLARIECIDISAIQGQWATGSLVVFTAGLPDTDEYRRFRIKMSGRPNDVGMMTEVIKRRFAHPQWPLPDLLLVDGGRGQVQTARQAIQATRTKQAIPIIGLAKRFEEIIIPYDQTFKTIRLPTVSPALHLLQHIRDEAHRFAKRYHIMLRSLYK